MIDSAHLISLAWFVAASVVITLALRAHISGDNSTLAWVMRFLMAALSVMVVTMYVRSL
jgi:hypothetical protein